MRKVLIIFILFLFHNTSLALTFDENDPLIVQSQIQPPVLHPGEGFITAHFVEIFKMLKWASFVILIALLLDVST